MQHPAWILVIVGVLIAVIGIVWMLVPSIPWLGSLPGDIVIERENFRFYFPIDDMHLGESAANRDCVAGSVFVTITKIRLMPMPRVSAGLLMYRIHDGKLADASCPSWWSVFQEQG